ECKKQFGDEINESEYDSRKYTYDQIPKHFTFDKAIKQWKPKLGGKKTVGRPYIVSHKELELFSKNGLLWNQLQLVDVIIWDEAPMASKWAIESVDKKLKEIVKNDKDFGVLMIFGGDFRQVLPFVKVGGRNEQLNASIYKSNLWIKFDCLMLKKNMRTGEGSEDDSDDINDCVLRLLKCEPIQLLSSDKATLKNGESLDEITRDVLNNLTPAALPPHILNIKIGASVMLLRNMNVKLRLCNGTQLRVIAIKPSVIQCIILTGPTAGTVVFVPKMDITSIDTDYPFILHHHQFPLKLCYAMTINKSQGQSLNKVQKNE
ncbi:MAG: putative ATP-dependent DNA helicase PIF1, partial [Streblomastix strix]